MDLCGIRRSGYCDEIEIKISKADYNADFNKTFSVKSEYTCISAEGGYEYHNYYETSKHMALKNGHLACNYFSFLMPEDISTVCEIPEHAGLYVYYLNKFNEPRIKEVKKAPLLHKRKIDLGERYNICRKMTYRYWDTQKTLLNERKKVKA